MKGFINTIRTGIFTVAVAAVVAPLTALAGDHGGSNGGGSGGGSSNHKDNKWNATANLVQGNTPGNFVQSLIEKHHDKPAHVDSAPVGSSGGSNNGISKKPNCRR